MNTEREDILFTGFGFKEHCISAETLGNSIAFYILNELR